MSGSDYSQALACFDVLDDMIVEGKVRFKGMTAHSDSLLTGLLDAHGDRVDVIMGFCCPINDGFRGFEGTVEKWHSLFRLANSKDIGAVAMKVLISSLEPWSRRENKLKNDAQAWGRLQPFLDAGYTVSQACIRWALSNNQVHTAVIGMRAVSEAEEDVTAMNPNAPAQTTAGGCDRGDSGGG